MKFGDEATRISTVDTGTFAGPKEASLVQIYGPNLGQRYLIDKPLLTIGRDERNDIVLDNDNISRKHAQIVVNGPDVRFEDLGSTNGSLLNNEEVQSSSLRNGDILKIGSVILKFLTGGSAEAAYHEEIYRMTIRDGLTDVANRRYFEDFFEREMARAERYDRPLSLMLIDADHFKRVNDDFGHLAGDYVLKHLASLVQKGIRREELLARYGGEEFVIVMPEVPEDKAIKFAEKIRLLVAEADFEFDGRKIDVTISIGVATRAPRMSPTALVNAADKALYAAKEGGRNRVVVARQ